MARVKFVPFLVASGRLELPGVAVIGNLFGDTDASGHVILPSPPERDPGERIRRLRSLGVPREWWEHCDVSLPSPNRQLDESVDRVTLRVGFPDPPRSLADLELAVELGLGIALQPEAGMDLRQLVPALAGVEKLTIGGVRPARGWSALADCHTSSLFVGRTPEMLPPMPELTTFDGMGANAVGILASPHLQRFSVDLEGQAWPEAVVAAGPVVDMQIMGARRLHEIPRLANPLALRVLRIDGPNRIDVSRLADAEGLEWIDLSRTREITGFAAIAHLPALQRLDLANVRRLVGWEDLANAAIDVFTIEPNHIIPDLVADELRGSHPSWRIARYRP